MLMGYGLMELCHLMSAHCYIDILKHFVVCPSIQMQTISISQSYFPSGVLLNLFLLHVCHVSKWSQSGITDTIMILSIIWLWKWLYVCRARVCKEYYESGRSSQVMCCSTGKSVCVCVCKTCNESLLALLLMWTSLKLF